MKRLLEMRDTSTLAIWFISVLPGVQTPYCQAVTTSTKKVNILERFPRRAAINCAMTFCKRRLKSVAGSWV